MFLETRKCPLRPAAARLTPLLVEPVGHTGSRHRVAAAHDMCPGPVLTPTREQADSAFIPRWRNRGSEGEAACPGSQSRAKSRA